MNDNNIFDATQQINPHGTHRNEAVPEHINDRAADIWGAEDISLVAREGTGYAVYLLTDEDDDGYAPMHLLDAQGRVRCNHAFCVLLEGEANKWAEEDDTQACASCGVEGPCPCQLDDEPYDDFAAGF